MVDRLRKGQGEDKGDLDEEMDEDLSPHRAPLHPWRDISKINVYICPKENICPSKDQSATDSFLQCFVQIAKVD